MNCVKSVFSRDVRVFRDSQSFGHLVQQYKIIIVQESVQQRGQGLQICGLFRTFCSVLYHMNCSGAVEYIDYGKSVFIRWPGSANLWIISNILLSCIIYELFRSGGVHELRKERVQQGCQGLQKRPGRHKEPVYIIIACPVYLVQKFHIKLLTENLLF